MQKNRKQREVSGKASKEEQKTRLPECGLVERTIDYGQKRAVSTLEQHLFVSKEMATKFGYARSPRITDVPEEYLDDASEAEILEALAVAPRNEKAVKIIKELSTKSVHDSVCEAAKKWLETPTQ